MTELEAVRILGSALSGPSERIDAEAELVLLGWRPLAIALAKKENPGPVGAEHPLVWHPGKHYWQAHDGYRLHGHSKNGDLTIDPHDTGLHFEGGRPFRN